MTFKELLRPKPINWKQTINALVMMCVCLLMGVMIGFYAGTRTFPTLTQSEGIAPPTIAETTTAEVLNTIDEVSDEEYRFGHNCVDFAWDASRALAWKGQPSRMAGIIFEGGEGHVVVLTVTTDEGCIYIDAQTGTILKPKVGGMLCGQRIIDIGIYDWIPVDVWLEASLWPKNQILDEVDEEIIDE